MKKIYAFTLDSEDYPSSKYRYNLKLIAGLLYGLIYNYDGEYATPLNINKNIKINNLLEEGNDCYFDSEKYDDGFINYEPFFVGDRSFALTINDELMSDKVVNQLLEYALWIAKVNYRVSIETETYYSKDRDDEKNRWKAIRALHERIGYKFNRKFNFVKRLTNGNRYRTNINYYGR